MSQILPIADDHPFLRRYSVGDNKYYACLNFLVVHDGRNNPRTTVHELSHVFEHWSTPYGLIRDEIHWRQLLLCQEFLKEYHGNVPVPVHAWALRALHDSASLPDGLTVPDFDRFLSRYLEPWSICIRLIQVLDGCNAPQYRGALANGEAALLRSYETSLVRLANAKNASMEENCFDSVPDLMRSDDQVTACPQCTWQDDQTIVTFPFGGEHVSEAIAQVQEGLGACMGCAHEWKYLGLPFMVIEQMGGEKYSHAQPCRDATCLTIADLALFTPIGALYGRLRPATATWEDVHPGYRFERALAEVVRAGSWIWKLTDAESLADSICDALGWPRPRAFLELGASQDHPRLRRHKEACDNRLSDYMAFYDFRNVFQHRSPIAALYERHMPITCYPGHGTICCYPDGHTEPIIALEQVRDFYASNLCLSVMLEGLDSSLFPDSLDLGMYFNNVSTELEFAGLYAEKHPWANTNRFTRFD